MFKHARGRGRRCRRGLSAVPWSVSFVVPGPGRCWDPADLLRRNALGQMHPRCVGCPDLGEKAIIRLELIPRS
jgi:hypothetical protein